MGSWGQRFSLAEQASLCVESGGENSVGSEERRPSKRTRFDTSVNNVVKCFTHECAEHSIEVFIFSHPLMVTVLSFALVFGVHIPLVLLFNLGRASMGLVRQWHRQRTLKRRRRHFGLGSGRWLGHGGRGLKRRTAEPGTPRDGGAGMSSDACSSGSGMGSTSIGVMCG